jgi:hypothetical protein
LNNAPIGDIAGLSGNNSTAVNRPTSIALDSQINQQWISAPVDGKIVPLCREMLDSSSNHIYQGEI